MFTHWSPMRSMQRMMCSNAATIHACSRYNGIEAGASHLFGLVMRSGGVGVVLRNTTLVCGENIDSETLFGMQVGVGFGALVNAYQNQLRVERDRGESVRGHALDLSLEVHRDHGDTGGEATQSFTEFRWGNAHLSLG
jgi:hypothetical protein